MIYNKLEGTTAQSFKLGKGGVSIANESGQLKVIVPVIGQDLAYEFIIGVDELTENSKDIPSSEAIVTYIEDTIGNVLEGNYLDLSLLTEQTVQGPVVFAQDVTVEGTLKGPENFIIDAVVEGDQTGALGNVIIHGNLQVDGTTTIINSETLEVKDKNITLASGAENPAAADGAGITIDGADVEITYRASTDVIEINKPLSIQIDSSRPPIKTNSNIMIENLNADKLHGKNLLQIEAERVPRSLSTLSVLTYTDSRSVAQPNTKFLYIDDGSTEGKKMDISEVVRPSVFTGESEEDIEQIKIGDYIYAQIES
jgi:hypothetical protein